MCGLSGIYALNGEPIQAPELEAQIETIIHRGPDQGAIYLSPRRVCGLGARRLSIIDVAGGDQPLSNETGSIHLVYNGETYNHRSLRVELERLGHQPKSHSDAEVIVHGYEAWGPEGVLQRMRGMFALALWDEGAQQLFLARDRFGIKPLYYAEHGGRLIFASEIKAILAQPDFPRRVNLSALDAMLSLGFVPGPATMFEGIYKLPPAHFLIAQGNAFRLKKYWQLSYQENRAISEAEAAEQFLTLLQESVHMHLMSEVPLGALLSGGLDSGALVALIKADQPSMINTLAGTGGQWSIANCQPLALSGQSAAVLKTISIGFDQTAYDEAALALALAQFIGTEHHPIAFTAADFDDYSTVMRHLEEPQTSATALPIYKLYRACREAGLTVVLTGEGADELLGGYHWHRGDALVRPLLAWPAALRRLLAASPLPMSAAARRVLARGAQDIPTRYRDWLEIGGNGYRSKILSREVTAELSQANGTRTIPALKHWAEIVRDLPNEVPLHQTTWLESQTRMVDFINFEVDKMSMASSIEARVPYLDHCLWEFCATLPAHFKLKGSTEKHLLRQAAQKLLPEATRTRRKKGLASPYAQWLRAARLPDWAEAVLSPQALQQVGLFDAAAVQGLRRAHQAGQPHLGPLLMGVLSTQVWYDSFIK
ncbi:MAG: asparagine synthase (glutamine-hydrolyzing) [Chloroflexota bacterium]|nr:MAG: asparagine synthase (glutamine-hydrolyzing) [Chloroflexota bacterium]